MHGLARVYCCSHYTDHSKYAYPSTISVRADTLTGYTLELF